MTDEHAEQVALFQWAELAGNMHPELTLLFAVPNGAKLPWRKDKNGKRYSPEAMRLKKEGLKSGVPDVCLPVARGGFHGLFIEMKVGKNRPSEAQREWLSALEAQGYRCAVCYGADEAIGVVSAYLGIGEK